MSTLMLLTQEVESRVLAAHTEIIREFLERINVEKPPPCECGFHLRTARFQEALATYIAEKQRWHRTLKWQNTDLFHLVSNNSTNAITSARLRLVELAPCAICIQTLNPTHRRQSKTWNPNRARAWKELLR
jgi:hypothetical protein